MNIFFDVDFTLIDNSNQLRPGVHELLRRLVEDGHRVFFWSGLGKRWEVVRAFGLEDYVSDCFDKPLFAYERMLGPLGITPRPDYVVDDHPHLVAHFGGCVVSRYMVADDSDRDLWRVYDEIARYTARRR